MSHRSANLTDTEFGRLLGPLEAGELLRCRLPFGDGRMHIDRLQPFLCVYRKPAERPDLGTGQLLLGQAAYLLTEQLAETEAPLRALISRLTNLMIDAYGAALIFELWSAPDGPAPLADEPLEPPRYRIVTSSQDVPQVTLETLEHALIETAGERHIQIEVDYRSGAAPPGAEPLLPLDQERRGRVFLLGLEVPPLHRDPSSGKLIPAELRRLTSTLGHALRQAFYTFVHARARYRPAHYHELGPRAMTDQVAEVDRGLAQISDAFDLLLHVTPVNAEAGYARFMSARYSTVPEFLYRPQTVDPAALKRDLYSLPVEEIEDPALHHLFAAQQDELDREITMLSDRNTPRFLLESQQVYGGPDKRLLAIAQDILAAPPPPAKQRSVTPAIGAEAFAGRAEEELAYYREAYPELPARVELRDDVPGVMVSKGRLLVSRSMSLSAERRDAILHHEIGTHVLTYYNGLHQPLSQFHAGMPGYEETQEGIAVLAEYLCGGLTSDRLRLLAGRVMAVDSLINGADFLETFRLLCAEFGFTHRAAYTIAMRVHRGGGLTKDVVYLRGLIALLDYLAEGHEFDKLLVGKVALAYMDIVEELQWRQIISSGPLRPRYLDSPLARERLASLPSGSAVASLIE